MERGDIFFFYRPDVEDDAPESLLDVRTLSQRELIRARTG